MHYWNSRRSLLLGVGTAIAALALAACTPKTEVTVTPPSPAEQTGIAVAGTGSVTVKPDVAQISLGVEVTANTVAEARSGAATAMQQIQAALKAKGVAEQDVQTQYFNISPRYSYEDKIEPKITGFSVNNQVQVTVRNIDTASDVLDAAIAAGGNTVRVNGMTFTVDEPEQYLAEARAEAVKNARERAEVLAKAAGVTLGPPRSISETTNGGPGLLYESAAFPSGGKGGPTPVNPGEQQLQVTVSVVYGIAQ